MSYRMALRIAINLLHVPSQVRRLRSKPLPDGVLVLLRIAAGDADVERVAAVMMDRSRDDVRTAAEFFIEQILFAPYADSYRVLGATPQASAAELRRNLALLSKWLHPDRNPDGARSIFIGKVTAAWHDLKTPERRAAYDEARQSTIRSRFRQKFRRGSRRPWAPASRHHDYVPRDAPLVYAGGTAGFLRRALAIFFHARP
jgi:hypothetical protein